MVEADGGDRPALALRHLVSGFQLSQALYAAARLGVADELRDGPRASDDLADAVGAHRRSLYRLLRALAAAGVFEEHPGRRFGLTPMGACLCADAPEPVGGWAGYIGEEYYWAAWGRLLHSVRTGDNAFRHVHGCDIWEYRAERPEASEPFDRAMTDFSRQESAAVLAAYDFGRFACVVDVGGGQGGLLAAVLGAHPGVRGVLFEQDHVLAGAVLGDAGLLDRCELVAGDFFEAVPEGGDAYVLKAILHDWDDEDATAILRTCRRAMADEAVLLVLERELAPPNEGLGDKLMDLNMLVAPGGQERTREEYDRLLTDSGFRLVRSLPTPVLNVIEAVPV